MSKQTLGFISPKLQKKRQIEERNPFKDGKIRVAEICKF
jgi:hypothetical protein